MSKSPDAFRTISEVADWLGVQAHVLRFWESKFTQVKPVKRAGGRRYYRPADMRLLGGIKKLLHDDGMSIKEVQALLREHGAAHVAEFSHPVDPAAEDRTAAPPPADRLGDDWQSSLELSHEQAAQDAVASGSGPTNVVGFPHQSDAGPDPEAAASDTLQEPASAPAAVSPAAPDSAPDALMEPAAAAEPDSPAEPAAAPEPQMRMDLSPPAVAPEADADAETGQPGTGLAAAQEPAAEDVTPAAAEDRAALPEETVAASPWSDAAAGEAPEAAPLEAGAPEAEGLASVEQPAALQEPAPAESPEPLETPATAEAPQEPAPAPAESEDIQAADSSIELEQGAETEPAAPAAAEALLDPVDVSGGEPEAEPAQELTAEPASEAVPPPGQTAPEEAAAAYASEAEAQAPAAADTARPAEPGPQAEPEGLAEPESVEQPEQATSPEPAAEPDPLETQDAAQDHGTAAEDAPAAAAPPLTTPDAEPEPAEDTLVAAAGLQPDEPLDFGSSAEPFDAALPAVEAEDETDAAAADPAASFPPHDLDEAARQVDALEFASGFDPDADAAPVSEAPQDSTAAEQSAMPEAAESPRPEAGESPEPEAVESPVPEAVEPPVAEASESPVPEAASPPPAPLVPHHAVLAHLAAIQSLPPQSVEEIAACAEKLRAFSAGEAFAGALGSGPDTT